MKKVSCIIPAYNEGKSIGQVLSVVTPLLGTALYEIIVVDDCSNDNTGEIVASFPAVVYIEHTQNRGKSRSVADAIAIASGEYIFLLDADLRGLTVQNIHDLLAPIANDLAAVSISYRKNAWPLFPFTAIDYLSGERVLPKQAVMPELEAMKQLPSYGLEVFLNRIIIRNRLSIRVVQWPNVENVFNQHKYAWYTGVKIIVKIWLNVLSVVSVFEMYTQNIKMKQLLVQTL